jgi:hypothetical protein
LQGGIRNLVVTIDMWHILLWYDLVVGDVGGCWADGFRMFDEAFWCSVLLL